MALSLALVNVTRCHMKEQEMVELIKQVAELRGMTVNERLFASVIMDEF
jgi:hypothetical protein